MLIQVGSYSATVNYVFNPLGNKGYVWIAEHFTMGQYGLDIKARAYDHKSSAIRYAKQQLQIKYDANLARIKL